MSVLPERFVTDLLSREVADARTETRYRPPLVGVARADDPRFAALREEASPEHLLPGDLLAGARSVISFFIPFDESVVTANRAQPDEVAREWVVAYLETNALIRRATTELIAALGGRGFRAAAEPATDNFDREALTCRWSHKSVAVIAGVGSFGFNHLVITESGCGGRLGSVVTDAPLEPTGAVPRARCMLEHGMTCMKCRVSCPVRAIRADGSIDKQLCWNRCLDNAEQFRHLGRAEVCGKCATGPCGTSTMASTRNA